MIHLVNENNQYIGSRELKIGETMPFNATGFDKVDLFADYLGWGVGVCVGSVLVVITHYLFM